MTMTMTVSVCVYRCRRCSECLPSQRSMLLLSFPIFSGPSGTGLVWKCHSSITGAPATTGTPSFLHGFHPCCRRKFVQSDIQNPSHCESLMKFTKKNLLYGDKDKPLWIVLVTLHVNYQCDDDDDGEAGNDNNGDANDDLDHNAEYGIQSLCREGHLDIALDATLLMERHNISPSLNAYWSLLRACNKSKCLTQAKLLYVHLAWHGLESTSSLGEYLVSTLVTCGGLGDGLRLFHILRHRTVFSWTSVISGFTNSGKGKYALNLYQCMVEEGVEPNTYTIVNLLKACGSMPNLEEGKALHADAHRNGFDGDVLVANTLLSMYGKCGSIVEAENVFGMLPQRDILSWNLMLSAYVQQGQGEKALHLYRQMHEEGLNPLEWTFVITLQACSTLPKKQLGIFEECGSPYVMPLEIGQALHADARRAGHDSGPFVGSTLVSMYGKCRNIVEAESVFAGLSHRDIVSWNAIILAYGEQGEAEKALQMHGKMLEKGLSPNDRTFVIALRACGMLAEKEGVLFQGRPSSKVMPLEIGQTLHMDAQRAGFASEAFVGSALMNMYGKCGSILDVENVFIGLSQCNVVSCTVILSAYVEQGEGEKALRLYRQMQEEGISPDERTFVAVLQACSLLAEEGEGVSVEGGWAKTMYLEIGEALHSDAKRKGVDLNAYVGNTLVGLYGKCGRIVEAENVFVGLPECEVVSWNAMLSVYVENGESEKALQLFTQMHKRALIPDERTFVTALRACISLKEVATSGQATKTMSLEIGRTLHADAQANGFESNAFVGSKLVSMYGKCGDVSEAENVFIGLSQTNLMSWAAMLSAYVEQKEGEKALQLYRQMIEEGICLDKHTFVIAVQACCMLAEKEGAATVEGQLAKMVSLKIGQALHADAKRKGFNLDLFVDNMLVSMYGKCWSTGEAENVFMGTPQPDSVSWNAMLSAYVEQGEGEKALYLFKQMQVQGVEPTGWTFAIALQACCTLAEKEQGVAEDQLTVAMVLEIGQAFHLDAQRKGLDLDKVVCNNLVSMYGKCGSITDAEYVFGGLNKPDIVSWNVMLSAYVGQGEGERALQLYRNMIEEGGSPDERTFVILLQACCIVALEPGGVAAEGQSSKVMSLEIGQALHADARKKCLDSDLFVGSTLVSMYGKCGSIMEAENEFSRLLEHDVVSLNGMISAYVERSEGEKALQLFKEMQQKGVSPNTRSLVVSLQACCVTAGKERAVVIEGQSAKEISLEIGRALHADALKKGYDLDVSVTNVLVSMYGKCGSISIIEAENVLGGLSQLNVLSCNAMLSAYREHGEVEKVFQLYQQMLEEGVTLNDVSLVCILQACGLTGCLEACRQIHFTIVSGGYDLKVLLATTLVHAYGSCSSMVDAQAVFNILPWSDVVSWSALVAGYAREGNCAASLQIFEKMQVENIKPNEISFLALLSACSHAGLVDMGIQYFKCMSRDYGMFPDIEHYGTMVGLLGRAGDLMSTEGLVWKTQMQADLALWPCLLDACQKHGNVELGKEVFDVAVHAQPMQAAVYVLMSNIFADSGLQDSSNMVDKFRQETLHVAG